MLKLCRSNGGIYIKVCLLYAATLCCSVHWSHEAHAPPTLPAFSPLEFLRDDASSLRPALLVASPAQVGQFLSTVRTLPTCYVEALATLQDGAPSKPFDRVRATMM